MVKFNHKHINSESGMSLKYLRDMKKDIHIVWKQRIKFKMCNMQFGRSCPFCHSIPTLILQNHLKCTEWGKFSLMGCPSFTVYTSYCVHTHLASYSKSGLSSHSLKLKSHSFTVWKVSPSHPYATPNPNLTPLGGGSSGKPLSYQGKVWVKEVNALVIDPGELSHPFHPVRTQSTTGYEPGSGSSPNTESGDILTLDFSTSGTIKNKFLLFISYVIHDILL